MEFIAFDLETTGIVSGVDRIVEIAAVKFVADGVESMFTTLVDPEIPIPAAASAVNGIRQDMLTGKPKVNELLGPLSDFCGDLPLVAHNSLFDAQFLLADYKKFEIRAPKGIVIDTLPIARKILPALPNYKLGSLVQHLQIPSTKFHRAEQDAIYAGKLFLHLLAKSKITLDEAGIQKLIALTGRPEWKFPLIERKPKQLELSSLFS